MGDPTRSLRTTFRGIATVVGPTSAVTALLYYFGWTRTSIEAHQLGLDESLFGFSTQDYLLRSITSMLAPLVLGILATIAGLLLHAALFAWLDRLNASDEFEGLGPHGRGVLRRLVVLFSVVGVALLTVGFVGARLRRPSTFLYLATPSCVTIGIILILYAANLYRKSRLGGVGSNAPIDVQGLDLIVAVAVVMLVILSLFWNVSHYAAVKGQRLADTVERVLPTQPSVVLYTAKRLYLQPPVVETKLDDANSAYKYAYSGLKLLFRSDHRYFLRPSNPSSRANIVIPDGLDIRLEFYKG